MTGTKTIVSISAKIGERDKAKRSTPGKRFDLIPIKETTFKASPLELEEQLAIPETAEFLAPDPELMEELLDSDEADLEIVDEDRTSTEDAVFEFDRYCSVVPGIEPEVNSTPEVLLESVYPLMIYSVPGNRCHCRFEAPGWMRHRIPVNDRKYIYILRDFLAALAGWFEEEKPDFLLNPTVDNFVKNENCRPENCVVLQGGFLDKINLRMPENGKMTKTYLSRLYDKVWLFWPEWNMPLSAIFSEPYMNFFREAWVVEGCLQRYAGADAKWRSGRRYESGFSAAEFDLMAQNFDSLDPEELLYLLCRTTKMVKEIDKIYQKIIDKISGETHG